MNWTQFSLDTFIAMSPKVLNDNFTAFSNYLDVFYDGTNGVIIKPVETTGRVKGAKAEFVTAVIDNLVVRNQYTNLYDNVNTADNDFVNTYNGVDTSTRVATSESSTNYIWPYEPSLFRWIDLNTAYIKIKNDASYGIANINVGQEYQVIFDTSTSSTSPYVLLLESSLGGYKKVSVAYANVSTTWLKIICTSYDVSIGPKWVLKQFAGTFTVS